MRWLGWCCLAQLADLGLVVSLWPLTHACQCAGAPGHGYQPAPQANSMFSWPPHAGSHVHLSSRPGSAQTVPYLQAPQLPPLGLVPQPSPPLAAFDA